MNQNKWKAVDEYISQLLVQPDSPLNEALAAAGSAGLPAIAVSPSQGKMLQILARALDAHAILEIGTLGGYSTIWLARALPPGGRLITLEVNPRHAQVAQSNLARAGVADRVEIRVGKALDTLPELATEGRGPFDLIFIDADKPNNANYFEWALKLSRRGSLIVVDNVIREGRVIDTGDSDPDLEGVRQLNDLMSREKRVTVTEIQTVGMKGHDGFALALVN